MKYTISFSQKQAIKLGIKKPEIAIILQVISIAPNWAERDEENYYWVARQKILDELPMLDMKTDTVYRYYKKLSKRGFIKYKKSGKKDMIKLTKKGLELFVSPMSDKNPNPYVGRKSESPMSDKNPIDNKASNKDINILSDQRSSCKKSKDFSRVSEDKKFSKFDHYISKEFLAYQKGQFPKLVNDSQRAVEKGADTVRLLREQDDFTEEEIAETLRFAVKDDFWRDKALSVANIRKRSRNGNTKFQNIYRKFKNKPKSRTEQVMDIDLSEGEAFWKT